MKPQQQRVVLSVALLVLALAGPAIAFTIVNPRTTGSRNPIIVAIKPIEGSHRYQPLHLFNENRDDEALKEDWSALTKAAAKFVIHAGKRVVDAAKKGGTTLKKIVTTAVLPSHEEEAVDRTSSSETGTVSWPTIIDTEDEDMFNTLFEADLVVPPAVTFSVNSVVDQAARLLEQDETATALLGSSLWCGSPFSQSSSSTTLNSKLSTSVQASFDVYGTVGKGVATVAATDDNLAFVNLEVDNHVYRLHPDSSPSSASERDLGREQNDYKEPAVNSMKEESGGDADAIEVEVVEGVLGRSPYRQGSVLDAEILDKTFI